MCDVGHRGTGGYSPPILKRRLDTLLAERGLYESRSRAAAAVMAGDVHVDERPARKPGELVAEDAHLRVAERPEFVSRGGVKLANALDAFEIDPSGRRALDVGASTGGFTDCLLQRGAAAVIALDVAYGELHWTLRQDPRVTVVERRNARSLRPEDLPYVPDLVVVDVSFISLAKVLPAVLRCAADRFDCLALVKPQFEAGRERVGKGGVVRTAAERRAALLSVAGFIRSELGAAVLGFASSGLPGPAGNRESFVWLAEAGRSGALEDLEAAARGAEP
jgi:23S rRNA (cytidine1920-2'-O)/16S rRNA (cytidine1409-2'-O)-methyltransferase